MRGETWFCVGFCHIKALSQAASLDSFRRFAVLVGCYLEDVVLTTNTNVTKSMYSPKISADLIPRIYRAAKESKIPMTRWVNRVVERALPETAVSQQSCA